MTDKKQTDETLFDFDYSPNTQAIAQVKTDCEKIGMIKLVACTDYEKRNGFFAVGNKPGRHEYKVQGIDAEYSLGSTQLASLILELKAQDIPFKMTQTARQNMIDNSAFGRKLNSSLSTKSKEQTKSV